MCSSQQQTTRLFYLVRRQVINNAREMDVAALRHGVVLQGGQELGLGLLGHLTCNKTKDNCTDLPTR
jgi:hypothetical protein